MPETLFKVRWPDGGVETCYSPSTIIRDYYEVGRSYTLEEFLAASRQGLNAASDRVRMRYGSGCSRAMAQLAAIEDRAKMLDASAAVKVEGFVG
jgi:uncharacterized repeat protein (TIGR04042 family)